MRNAETASQVSDDECRAGICASCRLAVNHETGRLKWCMGGNDVWRTRIRLMLLIPVVILPLVIVFIVLSKTGVIGNNKSTRSPTPAALSSNEVVAPSSISEHRLYQDSHIDHHHHQQHPQQSSSRLTRGSGNKLEHTDEAKGFHPSGADGVHGEELLQRQRVRQDDEVAEFVTNGTATDQRARPKRSSDNRLREEQYDNTLEAAEDERLRLQLEDIVQSLEGKGNLGNWGADTRPLSQRHDEFSPEQLRHLNRASLRTQRTANQHQHQQNRMDGRPDADVVEDVDSDGEIPRPGSEDDEVFRSSSLEKENEERSGRQDNSQRPMGHKAIADDVGPWNFEAFWKENWTERDIRRAQAREMTKYMDERVDPCDDFYEFACGNWDRHNRIPKDKAGIDTFELLRESLDLVIRELLEEPQDDSGYDSRYLGDSAVEKTKKYYQSCMNSEILEERRERPLLILLNALGGWPILDANWDESKFDWITLVAQLRLYHNDVLISEWVGPDIKNSDRYIVQLDQTTLGLPTKEYFLQSSNKVYLAAYKNYLIEIASLLGASPKRVTVQAEELIDFEIQLANITVASDERRNISDLYHKMTLSELKEKIPEVNLQRYLTILLAREVSASEPVVLFAYKYLQDLVRLIERTPRRTVANYLLWRFIRHRTVNLDNRFEEAKQKFYYILFGRETQPPRWKICVYLVNANMGMAVGSMFVRKYFDEKSKNDTLSMTQEIQQAFRQLLDESLWLDRETSAIAKEKVDAMNLKIGYPDFILEKSKLDKRYEDVDMKSEYFFENTVNVLQHLTRLEQNRLGSPVNRSLWNTPPAIVNAYYSRNKNQIMFPAGILQPPFYHRHFPRSLNYGGIGVVIGHEITHGFDDKGRLFDKYGNLNYWWNNKSIAEFDNRANCLIDQYSRYVVKEVGQKIDGVSTVGENMADNGGIKQSFRAYKNWLKQNKNADERLPSLNMTGEQLFFLNFAQVWCGSLRPEAMKNKLKVSAHSPGKFRVIGTLSNFEEFAEIYNCPVGSRMNPRRKCVVW